MNNFEMVECSDGTMLVKEILEDGDYVFRNEKGQKHRTDGPASYCIGVYSWYQNNVIHRIDGPAMILPDGGEYWYKNGIIHREDGPAVTVVGSKWGNALSADEATDNPKEKSYYYFLNGQPYPDMESLKIAIELAKLEKEIGS